MKFFLLSFLPLLTLSYCQKRNEQRSGPVFQGAWLHYKYSNYLGFPGSTRLVQQAVEITAISFDPRDGTKAWLTFHAGEVRAFKLIFVEGKNWRLEGSGKDSNVIPLEMAPTGKAVFVGREMFHRVMSDDLRLIANSLYAGKYYWNGRPVLFLENGSIIGLDSFVRYAPRLDYSGDAGEGDRIELTDQRGGRTEFGVECDGFHYMKIYEIKCLKRESGDCFEKKLGKAKYGLNKEIRPSLNAWADYLHWQKQDVKKVERINELLKDISRQPYQGIGKPEPLRGNLGGWWSRRIDSKHRLVYRVESDQLIVLQCRYHC